MTLANASAGWVSNGAPQVAPAFANRMSTWSVCLLTSATSFSISATFEMSDGTEMALPLMPGRLFKAAHASSHALPLRDVMKTWEHPAWRRLETRESMSCSRWVLCDAPLTYPDAACNPNPLEPPVTTATLPSREKMDLKSSSLTSCSADMFSDYSMGLWIFEESEMS